MVYDVGPDPAEQIVLSFVDANVPDGKHSSVASRLLDAAKVF